MSHLDAICAKRLTGDLRLIKKKPLEYIDAHPKNDDMLIWYFMIKGPEDCA